MDKTKNCTTKRMTLDDEKNIIKYYKEGKSGSEILELLNYKFKTTKTVYDILRKHNIDMLTKSDRVIVDNFYFSNINTPNKAYILGLMLTDGWVFPKRNQVAIQLQEDDLNIIEKIKEEWGTDNKIITCTKKPFKGENGNIYQPKPLKRILVCSKKMIEDLKGHGIVNKKSLIVTLPILDKYTSHLFRGIIDGDGSIYIHSQSKEPCVRFLGSHYLIAQICLFLHLHLNLKYHRPSMNNNISFVDYSSQEEVIPLVNWLYKDINNSFCIERKKDVIKDIIS